MAGKRISELTEQTGLSSGDFFGVDNAGQTASKKLNSEYFTKRFANVQNDTAFPTGDAYSSSSSYKVGDYVTHNDVLYRCKTACSAASWTVNATNFEEASLTKAVTELNSSLTKRPDYASSDGTESSFVSITQTTKANAQTIFTATKDCYINIEFNMSGSGASYGLINNGYALKAFSSNGKSYIPLIPLKSGDVIKVYKTAAGDTVSVRYITMDMV